jgi:hypothetical protein
VDAPPAKASASASDYVAAVGGRVEPVAEARSTLAEPETPVTASAEPGGDDAPRMMVASSAGAGQFAELADARQSGRRRPADSTHEPSVVVLAPRRQIRVDVIHGSF